MDTRLRSHIGRRSSPPSAAKTQRQRGSPSNSSDRSGQSADSGADPRVSSSVERDNARPARRRASKPKVRTGCISCKKRHVKCDEAKPSCAECDRLGLMCEGYALPKLKLTGTQREHLLLPKSRPPLSSSLLHYHHHHHHYIVEKTPSSASPLLHPSAHSQQHQQPALLPTPNPGFEYVGDDGLYFTLFRDLVAHELSPYYHSNFWLRTALRDSHVHKCIHHSILSIGAYARALMDLGERDEDEDEDEAYHQRSWQRGKSSSRQWWPSTVVNRHHQAALLHQSKALSHLRSDINAYGSDARVTMAATLLFIVFENMQGNYHSSGNLIRSGIMVLRSHRRHRHGLASVSSSSSTRSSPTFSDWHRRMLSVPPDEEVDEIADIYARHSIVCAYLPFSHGKYAYHLLFSDETSDDSGSEGEDDSGGGGLDEPAGADYYPYHQGRPKPPYTHHRLAPTPQSLPEARRSWDHLMPRLANFQSKAVWHSLNPSYDFDEAAARREQAAHLAQLSAFGAGLEALTYVLPPAQAHLREARGLELLRLHHAVATVFVACCLDPSEMAYDDYAAQFADIVRRCRDFTAEQEEQQSLLPHPQSEGVGGGGLGGGTNRKVKRVGFTNEVGVLPILAFVAAKCRLRAVRMQAVELLRGLDCREGIWHSASLAEAVMGIVRLEGQEDLASPEPHPVPPVPVPVPQQRQQHHQHCHPHPTNPRSIFDALGRRDAAALGGSTSSPSSSGGGDARLNAGPLLVAEAVVVVPPENRYTWSNMFWDFSSPLQRRRVMNVEYTKVLPGPGADGEFETVRFAMEF